MTVLVTRPEVYPSTIETEPERIILSGAAMAPIFFTTPNNQFMRYPMQAFAIAGAASGCPEFDAIKSIEFHRNNILTGADFAQPPHKSLLQKLVDFLRSKGHPL